MAANRRLDVLRAIVTDYVETQEPVGSKSLVERHRLGVSAATIRNDMAALEEEGYICQPHTSAGRVPTDKGYRYFVDQIDQIKPLSVPERRAITEFFTTSQGIEDVMENTVRLLAHLTHQTAVVEFPDFKQSQLRHLELVRLGSASSRKILAVIIADSGRVDQVLVEVPQDISDQELRSFACALTCIFTDDSTVVPPSRTGVAPGAKACLSTGKGEAESDGAGAANTATPTNTANTANPAASATQTASTRGEHLEEWVKTLSSEQVHNAQTMAGAVQHALAQGEAETRIVMAGMANLSRSGDFSNTLTPLVEALEEQVVLLKLFNERDAGMVGMEPVSVIIGQEAGHEALAGASIVSSSYDAGTGASHLGVIGPTRMDYPGSIAAVRAVARYLSRILNQ